jgi:5-methyltetrahydropteroyltriglutamate--homocysteine methyltransferase
MLFPTSLVGSYPQPEWLIDRARLADRLPPRIRASDLRRVDPAHLERAQLDATLLAIRAQERAGLDVVTDGEIRRESYSNHFATALDGVDVERPGVVDLGDMTVETPEVVAERARRARPYVDADRIVLAPDCGMMRYLPCEVADGKLRAMTAAAATLRNELS